MAMFLCDKALKLSLVVIQCVLSAPTGQNPDFVGKTAKLKYPSPLAKLLICAPHLRGDVTIWLIKFPVFCPREKDWKLKGY